MFLVATFLVLQGIPALTAPVEDLPYGAFFSFVVPLVFGTVWVAFLALLMGVPVAVAIALFISHYAPRRLAAGLGYVIDLLAAVPSVVYGLWGIGVLAPALQPSFVWLTEHLGFIPLFAGPASGTGRTIFTVAVVLAVMILPIVTALSREVFLQTPRLHEEAALALGATRWEMIKMAVLPFARPGRGLGQHARSRPGPRRDDGGGHGALAVGHHLLRAAAIAESRAPSPPTSR